MTSDKGERSKQMENTCFTPHISNCYLVVTRNRHFCREIDALFSRRFLAFPASVKTACASLNLRPHPLLLSIKSACGGGSGLSAEALLTKSRWINVPEFLWKPLNFWPRQPTTTAIHDDDPEVKLSVQAFSTVNSSQVTMDAVLERFSSWERLKRFVAWILRYRANLRMASARGGKTESTTRSSNPEIELDFD